jgi:2-oxoglutarate ferredoxin oxidoreductase subunit beta
MDYLANKYLRPRKIPSTACSGCGLGVNQKALVQAIFELDLEVDDIVWGTSIGCAGRQTFGTWKGDGFAGTHGRVYAIARGLRLALPPEKKIVLTVGDGDAFGIGLMHLIHACRSNADLTILVNDNLGYMSTGGQYGWTTPAGSKTDSSPYGMYEQNLISDGMDILGLLKNAGATFLARHVSTDGPRAVKSIKKGIKNRGLSLIHMVYPCPTNFGSRELGTRNAVTMNNWIKDQAAPMGKEKDNTVWSTGIYHDASNSRPEFQELINKSTEKIRKGQSL